MRCPLTVLVPGLHLLDAETYASAGLMRQFALCAAVDEADPFDEVYVLAS